MSEEIEMGKNAKIDLAEVDKNIVLMQKWICKHKGLIPESISKACQSI